VSATIASDEDMDWGYVLADEHAPDYETARRVLREHAVIDWGMTLGSIGDSHPKRRSYRWSDESGEDELVPCEPGDPRRDSDWWVFDLSMNDHDLLCGGRS
jgi:hypothetical protein